MSINQRTHAQFPHNKKANDEQENDKGFFFIFQAAATIKYPSGLEHLAS